MRLGPVVVVRVPKLNIKRAKAVPGAKHLKLKPTMLRIPKVVPTTFPTLRKLVFATEYQGAWGFSKIGRTCANTSDDSILGSM